MSQFNALKTPYLRFALFRFNPNKNNNSIFFPTFIYSSIKNICLSKILVLSSKLFCNSRFCIYLYNMKQRQKANY